VKFPGRNRQHCTQFISTTIQPHVLLLCNAVSNKRFLGTVIGWLEFNVPFQHKYGFIRDDLSAVIATVMISLGIVFTGRRCAYKYIIFLSGLKSVSVAGTVIPVSDSQDTRCNT